MQLFITGANGRVGRMLRLVWAGRQRPDFQQVWSSRRGDPSADVIWDIETSAPPALAKGAVILHLAAVLRGDPSALRANSIMALNVCDAAKEGGARHVFLASSSAVYGASQENLAEVRAPAPLSDYGRAKLAMEKDALCWAQGLGKNAPGVTCLRIGNVLGADALFGSADTGGQITLDPTPGGLGGPQRSYIGPQLLAQVIAALVGKAARGANLPPILNIAAQGHVFMADLLQAAKMPYRFGPARSDMIPKVCLSTKRLARLVDLPVMDAREMVEDWRAVRAGMQ